MFSRLSYLLEGYQQEMFPADKPTTTTTQQQPQSQPSHQGNHTRHESQIIEISEKSEIRITTPRPAVLRLNHVELSPLDMNQDNWNRDMSGKERGGETGSARTPVDGDNYDPFADSAPDAVLILKTPVVGNDEHERDPFADPGVKPKAPERTYTGGSMRRG
jgi:hypothetical protein